MVLKNHGHGAIFQVNRVDYVISHSWDVSQEHTANFATRLATRGPKPLMIEPRHLCRATVD